MTPELFTSAWFSALGAIILIDLVLAGDNALVIGLAARNVPPEMQRKVVLWGTFGAIAIRALLTAVVVYLLKIPGFLVIGGIALIYIGWRLTQDNSGSHEIAPANSVRGAVRTIIVADAVMGVDNVLAVGGAAQGSMLLVLVGQTTGAISFIANCQEQCRDEDGGAASCLPGCADCACCGLSGVLLRMPNRRDLYPGGGLRLRLVDGTVLAPATAAVTGAVADGDGLLEVPMSVTLPTGTTDGPRWVRYWCYALSRDGVPSRPLGPYTLAVGASS